MIGSTPFPALVRSFLASLCRAMTRFSWLIVLGCACVASSAQAQPTLSFTRPHAVQPGATTEIVLHGDKLEEPLSVWTSFPAQVEVVRELDEAGQPKPNPDPKTLRVRLTLAADVAVSVGGVTVGNKAGVSEPVLLLVDDLPTVDEASNNQSPATAQEIPALAAVDAIANGATFDYYRIPGKAGQRVAIEVVAQRFGSPLDPVLRLLDERGQELQFVDDDPALGADCRLTHTFVQDGAVVLEVRDVQYRAGGRYRLRVGDFPLVHATFPLGAPRGVSTEFRFAGPDGDAAAPATCTVPADAAGAVPISARLPGGQSSGMAAMVASALPNLLEVEPNDQPEAAQEFTPPMAINGQFLSTGDRDHYRFTAKKDEKLLIRGLSRTLGSPSYLLLRVFDEKGAQLAEVGAANDVETLVFTPPADGGYRVSVEELLGGGGPGYAYRIEVEPDQPRFRLLLKNDKNTPHKFLTHADGALALDVQIERQGYNGPIRVIVSDASGASFQVRPDVIPAGAKDARLIVLAPSELQEGQLFALRVTGEAVEGDARAPLTTAPLLKTKRPELLSVPGWLDGVVFTAIGSPPEAFFALTLKEPLAVWNREKNEARLTLPLERKHKDYKQDPLLLFEGLPPGVTAAVKKEGQDQDERLEVTFSGQDVPAGEHTIQVLAYGDLNQRGIKQVLEAQLKVE